MAGGVGFHPSLDVSKVQCGPHNISQGDLGRSIKCPLLLLPAGNDDASLKPGGKFFGIVKEAHPLSNSIEYAQMKHGWVSRGTEVDAVIGQSEDDETVAAAQRKAVEDASAFLREV